MTCTRIHTKYEWNLVQILKSCYYYKIFKIVVKQRILERVREVQIFKIFEGLEKLKSIVKKTKWEFFNTKIQEIVGKGSRL